MDANISICTDIKNIRCFINVHFIYYIHLFFLFFYFIAKKPEGLADTGKTQTLITDADNRESIYKVPEKSKRSTFGAENKSAHKEILDEGISDIKAEQKTSKTQPNLLQELPLSSTNEKSSISQEGVTMVDHESKLVNNSHKTGSGLSSANQMLVAKSTNVSTLSDSKNIGDVVIRNRPIMSTATEAMLSQSQLSPTPSLGPVSPNTISSGSSITTSNEKVTLYMLSSDMTQQSSTNTAFTSANMSLRTNSNPNMPQRTNPKNAFSIGNNIFNSTNDNLVTNSINTVYNAPNMITNGVGIAITNCPNASVNPNVSLLTNSNASTNTNYPLASTSTTICNNIFAQTTGSVLFNTHFVTTKGAKQDLNSENFAIHVNKNAEVIKDEKKFVNKLVLDKSENLHGKLNVNIAPDVTNLNVCNQQTVNSVSISSSQLTSASQSPFTKAEANLPSKVDTIQCFSLATADSLSTRSNIATQSSSTASLPTLNSASIGLSASQSSSTCIASKSSNIICTVSQQPSIISSICQSSVTQTAVKCSSGIASIVHQTYAISNSSNINNTQPLNSLCKISSISTISANQSFTYTSQLGPNTSQLGTNTLQLGPNTSLLGTNISQLDTITSQLGTNINQLGANVNQLGASVDQSATIVSVNSSNVISNSIVQSTSCVQQNIFQQRSSRVIDVKVGYLNVKI